MKILISSILLCSLLLTSCGGASQSSSLSSETKQPASKTIAKKSVSLTVSAGAGMKDAIEDVSKLYQQQQPKTKLTLNFGSSGSLQRQIEQGAPVDVFISAASKQMNTLENQELLVENTRKNLLKNQVVLIVPANDDRTIGFQSLKSDRIKRIAIGEPKSVPVGKYAQETLDSLQLSQQLKQKIVFAKDVRQVLSYVATGNADAGVVYATDAKKSARVKVVAVASENLHSPVVFPVSVIKSKHSDAGKEFVSFLSSQPAKDIFNKYGFITY